MAFNTATPNCVFSLVHIVTYLGFLIRGGSNCKKIRVIGCNKNIYNFYLTQESLAFHDSYLQICLLHLKHLSLHLYEHGVELIQPSAPVL